MRSPENEKKEKKPVKDVEGFLRNGFEVSNVKPLRRIPIENNSSQDFQEMKTRNP